VNSGPLAVPWSFIDQGGNTTPQAGEFMKMALDLTAVFGITAPHFTTFLAETRSSNPRPRRSRISSSATSHGRRDQRGQRHTHSGGQDCSIVLSDGQGGISYNFGEVLPVTVSGQVYQDTNGNNVLNTGEPGISGVTLTLSGTNDLGQAISATTTTLANAPTASAPPATATYFGRHLPDRGDLPSGYLTGAAAVGTVNGIADGTVVSATNISSIALTSGQNGINYLFGDVQPVTLSGTVYQDTNGNNAFNTGEPGISGVTLTLSGTNNLGQAITATTTTASNGTYSFSTSLALRPAPTRSSRPSRVASCSAPRR